MTIKIRVTYIALCDDLPAARATAISCAATARFLSSEGIADVGMRLETDSEELDAEIREAMGDAVKREPSPAPVNDNAQTGDRDTVPCPPRGAN